MTMNPLHRVRRLRSIELLEHRNMLSATPIFASLGSSTSVPIYTSQIDDWSATLYLDFDGFTVHDSDAPWNPRRENTLFSDQQYSERTRVHRPFDIDNDFLTYSYGEQHAIWSIAQYVDEDYSPFRVRVTTDASLYEPFSDVRIIIASDYYGPAGGVADFARYTGNNFYTAEQRTGYVNTGREVDAETGFVSTSDYYFIGTTASHEAGHIFGLRHHSKIKPRLFKDSVIEEYHPPFDDTAVQAFGTRSVIMGSTAPADRSVWSSGPTSTHEFNFPRYEVKRQSATARLDQVLGRRPDDHANTIASATALQRPLELVPSGRAYSEGILETPSDVDVFSFTMAFGGTAWFDVGNGYAADIYGLPSAVSGYHNDNAANVNLMLDILAADGTLLRRFNPYTDLAVQAALSLGAGTYYARVLSLGDYGDIGRYYVQLRTTTTPDDHQDFPALATPSLLSQDNDGRLTSDQDIDWMEFPALADVRYDVSVDYTSGRARYGVYQDGSALVPDISGSITVSSRTDAPLQIRIIYDPLAGPFRLTDYNVRVSPRDDFGETASEGPALFVDDRLDGALETPGDLDWVSFFSPADSVLDLSLTATGIGTTLQLYDDGVLVREGGVLVPAIETTTGSPGPSTQHIYFENTGTARHLSVRISATDTSETGRYSVALAEYNNTKPIGRGPDGALAPGQAISSFVTLPGEHDVYSFKVHRGQTYELLHTSPEEEAFALGLTFTPVNGLSTESFVVPMASLDDTPDVYSRTWTASADGLLELSASSDRADSPVGYALSLTPIAQFSNPDFLDGTSGNDDSSNSTPVLNDQLLLNLSLHDPEDSDWFSWSIDNPGAASIVLSADPAFGTPDVYIYRLDGTLIDSASVKSGALTISTFEAVGASTYLVEVVSSTPVVTPNYSLRFSPAGTTDAREPNDTISTAAPLSFFPTSFVSGIGTILPSDEDWYSWSPINTGVYSTTLDFLHRHGDLDLEIYDADGVLLEASRGISDRETVDIRLDGSTTVYYRVYGHLGASNPAYYLTSTHSDLAGDFNADFYVDASDYAAWRSNYGAQTPDGSRSRNVADANGDGVVNAADYTLWRDQLSQDNSVFVSSIGDYDNNSRIDTADQDLWRENYGAAVNSHSRGDGNGDGLVNAADYTVWRDAFSPPNQTQPTNATAGSAVLPNGTELAATVESPENPTVRLSGRSGHLSSLAVWQAGSERLVHGDAASKPWLALEHWIPSDAALQIRQIALAALALEDALRVTSISVNIDESSEIAVDEACQGEINDPCSEELDDAFAELYSGEQLSIRLAI